MGAGLDLTDPLKAGPTVTRGRAEATGRTQAEPMLTSLCSVVPQHWGLHQGGASSVTGLRGGRKTHKQRERRKKARGRKRGQATSWRSGPRAKGVGTLTSEHWL